MKKRVLFSILSLVLVIGCTTYGELEVETSDQVLGGDGYDGVVDNPYWDWVDAYPGLVATSLPRVNDVEVTVKGGYSKFDFDESIFPLQSTGCYAGPSEIIYIDVPANAPANMYVQIGIGHTLFDSQYRYRYTDVTVTQLLEPGLVMSLMNYFGGFVYVYYNHDEGDIPATDYTLTISNTIQAENHIYGETNDGEWRTSIMSASSSDSDDDEEESEESDESEELTDVTVSLPWLELISDRIIITTTLESIQAMDVYPTQLMYTWNSIIETRADFFGSSSATDGSNQMPLRLYTDLNVPWEAQTTASYSAFPAVWAEEYPAVVVSNSSLFENRILDRMTLLDDPTSTWYTWTSSSYLSPISCAFADIYKSGWWTADTLGITSIEQPVKYLSLYYNSVRNNEGATPYVGIDFVDAHADMLLGKDVDNAYTNPLPKQAEYTRYTSGLTSTNQRALMYAQLMHYSDWKLLGHVGQRSIELGWENVWAESRSDVDNYDFFAMCAAEYLGKDLRPFFNWWRLPITAVAGDYMAENFDALEQDCVDEKGNPCYFFEVPITDSEDFIEEIDLDRGVPASPKDLPTSVPELFIYDINGMGIIEDVYSYLNYYYWSKDGLDQPEADNDLDYISIKSQYEGQDSFYYLFDGRLATSYTLYANLNANRTSIYDEEYTTDFDDEYSYYPYDNASWAEDAYYPLATDVPTVAIMLTKSLEINALAYYTLGTQRAARISDIEYYGSDNEWHSTYPDEFIITATNSAHNNGFIDMGAFYETYTATGIRFKIQPDGANSAGATATRGLTLFELYPAYYGDPSTAPTTVGSSDDSDAVTARYITYSSLF